MNYIFNKNNLLENPEKYMYTKFQGSGFFSDYFRSRYKSIELLNNINGYHTNNIDFHTVKQEIRNRLKKDLEIYERELKWFKSSYNDDFSTLSDCKMQKNKLSSFSFEESVDTKDLFLSILSSFNHNKNIESSKIWINHFVQRFEVTKKLFTRYDKGVRRGLSQSDNFEIYIIFSLILSIIYIQSSNLKYLNTLLKICDLMTSLISENNINKIHTGLLQQVILIEITLIKILLNSKGIQYEEFK